jgi:hypothetical protein
MAARTTKVMRCEARPGSEAFQYFGYEDGVAVYQSTKLWRRRADCARAAKQWERKP